MRGLAWLRWSLGLLVIPWLVTAGVQAEEPGGARSSARRAAARARAAGKTNEAVGHLLVGLGETPHAPGLLLDLIETTKADADAHALWSHALVAALSDGKGRFKLPKGSEALLDKKDTSLAAVAGGRGKAVQGLAKSAGRLRGPGSYVLALAYRDLARALTTDAPGVWKANAAAFDKAVAKTQPGIKAVVQALRKCAGGLSGPDPAGAKLELGRALRGMATQARGKALGSNPGAAAKLDSLADTLIREAQAELAAEQMKPLTVEQLRAMDQKAIAAFNAKHANIRRPGRALSESGRYLIVTPCGHGTLLATAEIADPTHDRLARWFGVDPFKRTKKARGEIRVYSTFADLESESSPYYWADGFQRGALVVLRCAAEREIDLARLLSHELMHRFDALLFPGLAGWLKEGRGVWAGGAFAITMGGDFAENYIDGDRVSDAGPHLYGERYWLEKFMRGDWDDYRDNYTAGHALWVYLYTWQEERGRPTFRPRLKAYLEAAGTGTKKPIELFAAHFADGRGGRPSSMDAFAAGFGKFLLGWRSEEEPKWFERYVQWVGDDTTSPYIEDPRTWHLERKREEPVYGQDHPARAAAILAESGQTRAAIGLLEWSLAVDDFEAKHARLLAALLEQDGRHNAAAALRPQLGGTGPILPEKHAVHDFARVLEDAAAGYTKRGLAYAAHVIQGHYRDLTGRLGLAGSPDALPTSPPNDHHALCGPTLHHAKETWIEAKLSDGYDKFREKDAWRKTAEGDLIVGKATIGTGGSSGIAGSPWTFIRSDRRVGGAYTLSGRIALLSPHCEGAIVLGWTRRDRNVRLKFDAGEWAQEDRALGAGEVLDEVAWEVTGLRYRDRGLSHAETRTTTRTEGQNEFAYRIDVDRDVVDVFIDGRRIATFAEGSGQTLAGFTGFAMRHGAIRVEQPRIRFHRAGARTSCRHGFPFGHDPLAPRRDVDKWILGRRILGAPRSERGTLLLWYPLPFVEVDADDLTDKLDDARMQMSTARGICETAGSTPSFAIYLPRKWPTQTRAAFKKLARDTLGDKVLIREHYEGLGPAADMDPDEYGYTPYVLFQDPNGVTRHMGRGTVDTDDKDLARWIRVFRGW